MGKKLYIVGAGSVGVHIASSLGEYSNEYELVGFFDDDESKMGANYFGYPVLGKIEDAISLNEGAIVIGIAFPGVKRKIKEFLSENSELSYPSFVHKKAWVAKNVVLGSGTVVYPGTSINYGTKLKSFIIVNMNCALGHHSVIGTFSSLAPGVNLGGHTRIGEEVEMGIGSATLQNVRIGNGSIVGGQSMVIGDVPDNSKVVGVPARKL